MSPNRNLSLSFVIVTYNSQATIQECLQSVYRQDCDVHEVVVVDNASDDRALSIVSSKFPQATILRNKRNVGFGAANNAGVRLTSTEFVAMVNPDVRLTRDWGSEILRTLGEHAEFGAAEGKLLLAEQPTLLNSRGSELNFLGFGCTTGCGEEDNNDPVPKLVGYPSGAAFAMRREVYQDIGGFDEDFFLYHEDVDLGLRLYRAGFATIYVPSAVAYHHYKPNWTPRKVMWLEKNRWRTLAKNMPVEYFILCGPLMITVEIGLVPYLWRMGCLAGKARAVLGFVEEVRGIYSLRHGTVHGSSHSRSAIDVLTDLMPTSIPIGGSFVRFAKRVEEGYFRAFFRLKTSRAPRTVAISPTTQLKDERCPKGDVT